MNPASTTVLHDMCWMRLQLNINEVSFWSWFSCFGFRDNIVVWRRRVKFCRSCSREV